VQSDIREQEAEIAKLQNEVHNKKESAVSFVGQELFDE
jgi:hypothetical protein